jgi:hypothetical protein
MEKCRTSLPELKPLSEENPEHQAACFLRDQEAVKAKGERDAVN